MWYNLTRVALSIRYALTIAIYKKSLRLSQRTKLETSVGRLQSLMSTDCNTITNSLPCFHWWTWGVMMKFIVPIYFLWDLVGAAFLFGMLVVVLAMPFTFFVARQKIKKLSKKVSEIRDERVHMCGEIIKSIQTVKCLVWELTVQRWIGEIRTKEMNMYFRLLQWAVMMIFGFNTSAMLMPLATFGYFVLTGNTLTMTIAFTSLTWLYMLRDALIGLPFIYQQFVQMSVSFDRIYDCLTAPTLAEPETLPTTDANKMPCPTHPPRPGHASGHGVAATFNNVTLSWFDEQKPRSKCSEDKGSEGGSDAKKKSGADKASQPGSLQDDSAGENSVKKEPTKLRNSIMLEAVTKEAQQAPWYYCACCMNNPYSNDKDKVLVRMATLKDINLKIRSGKLTVIVGPVASGKSTLISALTTGEAFIEGTARVQNSRAVCYAEQSPWLQSGSIKANILFGREEDSVEYEKVLTACGLDADLQSMASGDQTKVGEQGVRLSGGQRARVAMARACYNRSADLFIFDDSLAALDAIVSQEVFKTVFKERLAKRTRVLITHDPRWLEQAHDVIVVDNNSIAWAGPREVLNDAVESSSLLKSMMKKLEETYQELQQTKPTSRMASPPSQDDPACDSLDASDDRIKTTTPLRARADSIADRARADSGSKSKKGGPTKGVAKQEMGEDEEDVVSTGSVSAKVYAEYFHEFGGIPALLWITCICTAVISLDILRNGWLATWVAHHANATGTNSSVVPAHREQYTEFGPYDNPPFVEQPHGVGLYPDGNSSSYSKQRSEDGYYLLVYALLSVAQIFAMTMRWCTWAFGGYFASKALHSRLVNAVFNAPMSFFWTVVSGKIVNRFSSDMTTVDTTVNWQISSFVRVLSQFIAAVIVIAYSNAIFLIFLSPLMVLYLIIGYFYRYSERALKRVTTAQTSPLYAHFSESITGANTIRSFKVEDAFVTECESRVRHRVRADFYICAVQQFGSMYMDFLGAIIVAGGVFFVVYAETKGDISPHIAGLAISYALSIQSTFMWLIKNYNSMEVSMVCTERVNEYICNPREDRAGKKNPPRNWKPRGHICFDEVKLRYKDNGPVVLGKTTGLSLTVEAGSRIALVGRTGAGKSTIATALFRLQDAFEGRILLDDVNVLDLNPLEFRKHLSVVSQEPLLFTDSIRKNLDPLSEYNDSDLWFRLEQTRMKDKLLSMNGLQTEVTHGGENFSVGERQLLSMTRALLRGCSVLVLDEATASCDVEADQAIQDTVAKLTGVTVISIAHRLSTVLGYDKIAVLSGGQVVEYDTPVSICVSYLACRRSSMYTSEPCRPCTHRHMCTQARARARVRTHTTRPAEFGGVAVLCAQDNLRKKPDSHFTSLLNAGSA